MMKVALVFGIILGLILVSFLYDIASSLLHTNEARFHIAPNILCGGKLVAATLPPFGIWLCPTNFHNDTLRKQELTNWDKYKRFGTFGYYGNSIYEWTLAKFGYNKI